MTLPVVKHSYLITDINDIPRIVKEAFYIAQTGRPGPVLIDMPKNVQQARTQPVFPKRSEPARLQPGPKRASDLELNEIIGLIEKSERPGALRAAAASSPATRARNCGSSPRRRRFR